MPLSPASKRSANIVSISSLAGSMSKAGLTLNKIISTKPDSAAFTATFGLCELRPMWWMTPVF